MAIEGIDRLAMEDADQHRALQALAIEAMYAAQKATSGIRYMTTKGVTVTKNKSEIRTY